MYIKVPMEHKFKKTLTTICGPKPVFLCEKFFSHLDNSKKNIQNIIDKLSCQDSAGKTKLVKASPYRWTASTVRLGGGTESLAVTEKLNGLVTTMCLARSPLFPYENDDDNTSDLQNCYDRTFYWQQYSYWQQTISQHPLYRKAKLTLFIWIFSKL